MIELKIVLGKVERSNVGSIAYHEEVVPIIIANEYLEQCLKNGCWPVRIYAEDFTMPVCNSQTLQPS